MSHRSLVLFLVYTIEPLYNNYDMAINSMSEKDVKLNPARVVIG